MNPFPSRQRGLALLVALLAVALAIILIAGLLDRGELTLARTRNVLRSEQAQAYADGVEAYAARVLIKDQDDEQFLDTPADIWAFPLPPQPVPGGLITGQMRDMNGCFNLNNLSQSNQYIDSWGKRFQTLLINLGLDPALAEAVIDWIDADIQISGQAGAEDVTYLAQTVSYRAANRTFAHVSELRLVRGFSGEIYMRLAPHVCALPTGTTININTASVPVLMSLDSRITRAVAERLWQNGQASWKGIGPFVSELKQQGIVLADSEMRGFDVVSSYFLAHSDILFEDMHFTFYSLMERGPGNKIRVLSRSRGSESGAVTKASSPKISSPINKPGIP